MRNKKAISLLVASIVFILILAGCGGSNETVEESSSSSSEGGSAEEKVVKFMHLWPEGSSAQHYRIVEDIISQFEEENDGVKVDVEVLSNEQYKDKLKVLSTSDELPDVGMTWAAGFLEPYVSGNKFATLDDVLDGGLKDDFVVKRENKALVLHTIMHSSPISRADIASVTGLNKGTVSSLVSELIDEKLIYESGPGKSSGGRRPVMLIFNEVAGYSIGIDLGVNYILGVLTDQKGNIYSEQFIKCNNVSFEEMQNKLFHIIDSLIATAPTSPYGIIGIGIGVPGIVSKDGKVLLAPNLNWKDIHLQNIIERKYNLPTTIENEANAGAYGEKKFGVGKSYKHIVYVSVGIGIGVGLIFNGELYKGNNGFSGELGHMTIELNGKKCTCESKGCWELYASEKVLIENAQQLGVIPPAGEELSLESLLMLAKANDEKAIESFKSIGNYLGVGLNNIVNIFNPEQIIIGNRMAMAKDWIENSLTNQVALAPWFQQKDLTINFSELSTHSAALGMAAFISENFMKNYFEQPESVEV